MRVKINFVPAETVNEINIPLDFRRHFISLIKSMTSGSQIFTRFQEENPGFSPYVFSVNFRKILSIDRPGGRMSVVPPVSMVISTGSFEVMTAICNGAIRLKGAEVILGLILADFQLLPLTKINSYKQAFKIASHAILRAPDHYVDGSDLSEIVESINSHLCKRMNFLHEKGFYQGTRDSQQIYCRQSSMLCKGVCFHYGGLLTSLRGTLLLEGKPEALQFCYDYGLGVRCGQGFGLLEVMSPS